MDVYEGLTTEQIVNDLVKRVAEIENVCLKMTPVIDLANDYEESIYMISESILELGKAIGDIKDDVRKLIVKGKIMKKKAPAKKSKKPVKKA